MKSEFKRLLIQTFFQNKLQVDGVDSIESAQALLLELSLNDEREKVKLLEKIETCETKLRIFYQYMKNIDEAKTADELFSFFLKFNSIGDIDVEELKEFIKNIKDTKFAYLTTSYKRVIFMLESFEKELTSDFEIIDWDKSSVESKIKELTTELSLGYIKSESKTEKQKLLKSYKESLPFLSKFQEVKNLLCRDFVVFIDGLKNKINVYRDQIARAKNDSEKINNEFNELLQFIDDFGKYKPKEVIEQSIVFLNNHKIVITKTGENKFKIITEKA